MFLLVVAGSDYVWNQHRYSQNNRDDSVAEPVMGDEEKGQAK